MVLSSWLVRFKRTLLRPRSRGAAQHMLGPQRGEFAKSGLLPQVSPHIEVFENKALLSAVTFTVNTTVDSVDANVGDGMAQDAGGNTSLRAAIQEANATTGVDEIIINLPADPTAYSFTLAGDDAIAAVGDLDITNTAVPITIRGAGASATTISAANLDRIFDVAVGAELTISDVTLKDGNSTVNNPVGDGGIVQNAGTLAVIRTTLSNSQADSGGAIYNLSGNTDVLASTFSSNTSVTSGGAIYVLDGSVDIDASTFSSNTTTGSNQGGGAIWIGGGELSVSRSTFESNQATDGGGQGGAIFATGAAVTVQLTNSTLTSNTAGQSGGAIYLNNNLTSITSSTISNNNSGVNAAGIFLNAGTATLQNTVVAKNQADNDFSLGAGVATSLGNNFIGNGTAVAGAFVNGTNGDQVGNGASPLDPMLGTLADNGGPTQTLLPTATSPLIDTGNVPMMMNSMSPQTDQRGASRVVGGVSDIGAVETGFNGFFVNTLNDTVDDNLGDGIAEDAAGDTSLRAAIQEASFQGSNRVVVLSPEIYTLTLAGAGEDVGATGDLDLNGDIVVQGFGPRGSIIDANALDRVAHVASGASVTIADLKLRNGDSGADSGGGLLNEGFAFVSNVGVVASTTTGFGGGVENSGTLTLSNSAVRRNTAGVAGGGVFASGVTTLQNTDVTDNTAASSAGIHVGQQLDIFNSEISNNTATTGAAGGIGMDSFATLNISDTTVSSTKASSGAGGIEVSGMGTISGSFISNNTVTSSGDGGGIVVNGTLSLSGSTVAGNTVTSGSGGGISLADFSASEIEFSTIDNNTASDSGGGVQSAGMLNIQNTTLSNNSATTGSGGGLRVVESTGEAFTALSNVTVSSNMATDGGGIAATGQTIQIRNATITLNTSDTAGGLTGSGTSAISIVNSIVAGNVAAVADTDVGGTVSTGGSNVIGVAGGPFIDGVNGDQVGSAAAPLDPKLGALQDNGGGLATHELQAGSPAIDTGDNSIVTTVPTDQRGATRIVNATVDVGAFESGFAGFFVNTTSDTVDANPGDGSALDAQGNTSLRAAIMEANASTGNDFIVVPSGSYSITLSGRGEDGAATGDLDITDDLVIQGHGANSTTIDGRDLDRVFDVKPNSTVTINDLAITNGRAVDPGDDDGAGLRNVDSTVNLNRIDLRNNSALDDGGAIFTRNTSGGPATLNLVDSRVGDNFAGAGGGVYTDSDTVNITGTLFINNTATLSHGGAIFVSNATASITDSQISQNTSMALGGGVYIEGFGGETTTITTSVIEGNSANGGGGVYLIQETLDIVSSDIVNNAAQDQGGGGLYNEGTMTITDSQIIQNQVTGFSFVEGGGIYNNINGTLTITKSEIADNVLSAGSGFGGGISNIGVATVDRSTITGNMAIDSGGGINATGETTVVNSTISGNQAMTGGGFRSLET